MGLREARRADRQLVVGADELDQLARVLEAALGLRPLLLALRRIAAQGEDVLEAEAAHLVERGAQLVDGRADAGEVRHRLQADLVADALHDLERLAARRPAGAVGDADEVRGQRSQARERQVEVRLALGRPGREELEGEDRAIARRVDLVDAHRAHGRAMAGQVRRAAVDSRRTGSPRARLRPRPVPPFPDARQPPIQGDRRRPGRRRVPAVVARPPAVRRRAVARPARPRLDARLRGPRAELRPARADGDPRRDAPPLSRARRSRAQPPGRRARPGPCERRGDARVHRPAAARPPAPAHRPPAGRARSGAHHAGGAQGRRAQGRARADRGGAGGRGRPGAGPGARAARGAGGRHARREGTGEEADVCEEGRRQARADRDHGRAAPATAPPRCRIPPSAAAAPAADPAAPADVP